MKLLFNNQLELHTISLILTIFLITSSLLAIPTNSSAFDLKVHEDITKKAFPFLRSEIQSYIIQSDKYQDSFAFDLGPIDLGGPGAYEKNHFDACALKESSMNIQSKYNSLKRLTTDGSNYPLRAAWSFGELLHTVQDFYSHSNWAELGQTKIVDSGLGNWMTINSWEVLTRDIVPIEEPISSGWSISYVPQGSPIPRIEDGQDNTYRGLMTHVREGYKLGDHCPDDVDWNHDKLNKDGPTNDDYGGNRFLHPYSTMHKRAVNVAIDQTAHEWCRYLNLLKSDPEYGFNAVSVPMALWVDPTARWDDKEKSPHPAGTPCQPGNLGDKSVIVSINNIKVLKGLDDGSNPGDLNLSFVLYTGDLTRSVRTQTPLVEVQSGTDWPPEKLPTSLTMCLAPSDTLVATIQGWDDEAKDLKGEFNAVIYDTYDFTSGDYNVKVAADTALKGVTYAVSGPEFGQGINPPINSDNIEVTFEISQMSSCVPEGTTSKSTDIDKDGVINEQDNCMDDANRNQEDTDNDGKGDVCDPDLVDYEKDGVADSQDNCWYLPNPDQIDTDGDGIGDVCDFDFVDRDKDGLVDSKDNCSTIANPDQKDTNGDGSGDACQMGDGDKDGLDDYIDNCTRTVNPDQKDTDGDGIGDVCEIGPDTIY